MITSRAAILCVLGLAIATAALGADSPVQTATSAKPTYAYATNGVVDFRPGKGVTPAPVPEAKALEP